jgi:hypothetical protein
MKNEAPNKSYAACIEESLMTGTRMRETGKHDEADAWDRHSNDWCGSRWTYLAGWPGSCFARRKLP